MTSGGSGLSRGNGCATALSTSENPRPSGSRKLGGVELHRIRVGEYRAVYEVYDDAHLVVVVVVVAVGHRSRVYRRLRRL